MILLDEFIKMDVSDKFREMYLVVIQLGAIMAVVLLFWWKIWPFCKENNYERIELSVPKGKKAVIKDFAEKQNKSVNGFVNEAIDEKMERDK